MQQNKTKQNKQKKKIRRLDQELNLDVSDSNHYTKMYVVFV